MIAFSFLVQVQDHPLYKIETNTDIDVVLQLIRESILEFKFKDLGGEFGEMRLMNLNKTNISKSYSNLILTMGLQEKTPVDLLEGTCTVYNKAVDNLISDCTKSSQKRIEHLGGYFSLIGLRLICVLSKYDCQMDNNITVTESMDTISVTDYFTDNKNTKFKYKALIEFQKNCLKN